MKEWMKKRKSRGFTLVELLIVIVIIGILAGSLLLVMGSGTDKANATKIVSDMRTLKAAALMYYSDENKWPTTLDNVKDYLDRTPSTIIATYAYVNDSPKSGDCAIEASGITDEGIQDRLVLMAGDSGLLQSDLSAEYVKDDTAYMVIAK